LIETSEETEPVIEGCLSDPGVDAPVERAIHAVIEGTNLEGERIRIEGEGLLARAMQHEIDHLNGMLFVDHLGTARRQRLLKEYSRLAREEKD